MQGRVHSIYRHPVKGFTPEPLADVHLRPGEGLPHDRIYAVENGPCGFDPAAPAFVPKQKFTVLASLPQVAAARTAYDPATGVLTASAPGAAPFAASLSDPSGRNAFAGWLTRLLGEDVRGPLKVLEAPGHRFFDHPQGHISVINLASVRDLGARMGVELDPLRFRANLYVEGWPAWEENEWVGRKLMLGDTPCDLFKPIVRCIATHVHPATAQRDLDVTRALFDNYGHMFCGVYVSVDAPGRVAVGDICQPAEEHE